MPGSHMLMKKGLGYVARLHGYHIRLFVEDYIINTLNEIVGIEIAYVVMPEKILYNLRSDAYHLNKNGDGKISDLEAAITFFDSNKDSSGL